MVSYFLLHAVFIPRNIEDTAHLNPSAAGINMIPRATSSVGGLILESTALHLLTDVATSEVQPQVSRPYMSQHVLEELVPERLSVEGFS